MIIEYLAAAGGAFETYTLTVGDSYNATYDVYNHGYSAGSYGAMTPATYRGKTINGISTVDLSGGTFSFGLAAVNDGAGFWSRMEFERNGTLEKTIFQGQTGYLSGIGGDTREDWVGTGTGFDLTYPGTYTVRIYY